MWLLRNLNVIQTYHILSQQIQFVVFQRRHVLTESLDLCFSLRTAHTDDVNASAADHWFRRR